MMEITTVEHHQAMDTHALEDESLMCPKSMQLMSENKKPRPEPEQAPKCPRCDSTNTKFCYYNNYSLSQPRYFCKGCKRYWTKGGSLRNVPVGGGSRKNNKRSTLPSNSSSSLSKKLQDQHIALTNNNPNPFANLNLPSLQLPPISFDPSDLTLAFASIHNHNTSTIDQNNTNNNSTFMLGNATNTHTNNATMGFLDILRSGSTFVDHNATNGSYDQSMCYGNYGRNVDEDGNSMMFNFGGGLLNSSTTNEGVIATNGNNAKEMMDDVNVKMEEESKVSYEWPNISDHGVDSATRDYWSNGVNGGTSWHGLINSSLM